MLCYVMVMVMVMLCYVMLRYVMLCESINKYHEKSPFINEEHYSNN